MHLADTIRKLGFRKWYERELIKSHAALVTCFLCGLTVASVLERISFRELGAGALTLLAVVFLAVLLGWTSWRTYSTILQRAERYGEHSSCPSCKAYGRFRIVAAEDDVLPEAPLAVAAALGCPWMRVQCRRCGTAWRMPE